MYAASSSKGGVASQIHLATLAGMEVLGEGGNAFDAAIAVSSVLTVLLPHTSSVGGDGFMLAINSSGEVIAYNGSGRAPRSFPVEQYLSKKPVRGPLTVTVPGLVDMWEWVSENHGSLDLSATLARAISLAANGFYVQEPLARAVRESAPLLSACESWSRVFGHLSEGDHVRFPRLARILKLVAKRGADAFYRGRVAEELVEELRSSGVPISYEDFAEHPGERVEPVRASFGGYELYELPPNSQGVATLQLLKLMELDGLCEKPLRGPSWLARFFELAAMVYEDRDRHVADPDYYEPPLNELLSRPHLERMLRRGPAPNRCGGGDTTFFVVADGYGNLVGFIQSIFYAFGSGIVAGDVPFQNRAAGFAKKPGLPNSPAPGKRPLHTLSILLASHDARGTYIVGCAGGDYRPQIHAQVFANVACYGMPLSTAVNAPRAILKSWGDEPSAIVELGPWEGVPPWAQVVEYGSPEAGVVHALWRDRRGVVHLVADVRGGGVAAPCV